MEKRIEITRTVKIIIDEKHPEFQDCLDEFKKPIYNKNSEKPLEAMIKHAAFNDFRDIHYLIKKGIIKLVENSEYKEVEIYG